MTSYIKAPYNFVPLSKKVVFPNWAKNVSHDVPFEDAVSGEITIELEAKTPVFVRNGHTKADSENKTETYKAFNQHKKQYFIPATSVKGMLCNVFEIISFSKMKQVSDDRYSIRDLHNRDDYLNKMTGQETYCGWLEINNEDNITIQDCGIPGRLSHKQIDEKFITNFTKDCSDGNLLRNEQNRTAKYKYEVIRKSPYNLTAYFVEDVNRNNNRPRVDKREFFVFSEANNKKKGTIVFTGQPSKRHQRYNNRSGKNEWKGKYYEFVFFDTGNSTTHKIATKSELWKDFLFVYKDSEDWKYFKETFQRIPVFFKKNNDGAIESIGLSYLYKLPYSKRINDCIPTKHQESIPDLTDCVFGSSTLGLKGRIQVGHAFFIDNGKSIEKNPTCHEPLMGSPKPSYYPIYLFQKGKKGILDGKYNTYMTDGAQLKGWKRYPVHESYNSTFQFSKDQKKNTSPFTPLPAGSSFQTKIRFHNLKEIELGALLYSITLCDEKEAFHTLGFAKPYGFGKMQLTIKSQIIQGAQKQQELDEFKKAFEGFMNNQIGEPGWKSSIQVSELILMSKENKQPDKVQLEYMGLQDYQTMKSTNNPLNRKQYLGYYSELLGINDSIEQVREIVNKAPEVKDEAGSILAKETLDDTSGLLKAKITSDKKVIIELSPNPVQLVVPKHKRNIPLNVDQEVWVNIKQKNKQGEVVQVEYKGVVN